MKKIIILNILFIFCFVSLSLAGGEERLQYNPFSNKYEFIKPGDVLKYNPYTNTNEYVDPDATIKYNPFEDEYQFVDPPCKEVEPTNDFYPSSDADPDYDPYIN